MDERPGETARPQGPPSAAPPEAPNSSATRSLVLGIVAFVIQFVAWGMLVLEEIESEAAWDRFAAGLGEPPEQSFGVAETTIASIVSMAVGIGAIVFGLRGRRLAKAEALGRVRATIGLVLGINFVAGPIVALLAFITWINCCAPASF
jgi:hypothetical protein